tara:strand:- start:434 stop:1831 length:1398 start_codon:yes stop_codon:yes gene_type:complete
MSTWFNKKIKNSPNDNFIVYNNKSYSAFDLNNNININKRSLKVSNLNNGSKVVIFLPNGIEYVEIIIACLELGIIIVPISTKFTSSEIQKIIHLVEPDMIISCWELSKKVNVFNIPTINIEEFPSLARTCQSYSLKYKFNKKDVAAIILTSGTTDDPKAVQLTYENFESSCRNWNEFLKFNKNDQFLCCLPLHHVGGLCVLLRGLIYGFTINIADSFNPEIIYKLIKKYPISLISLVPTMLDKLLKKKDGQDILINLRAILLGGGPASDTLLDKCIEKKLNIVKTYGMTETCSGIVGLWLKEKPTKKHFSGSPFPEVKIKIVNDEIYIKGPMVMKGYINQPDTKDYHNSKDIGWLDGDNNLFIEMRRKDLIVSGGENINPKEVENTILKFKDITDCAVIGIDDEKWGQKVISYLVTNEKTINIQELIKFLHCEIAKHKIPKNFIILDNIPRNEIGKVNMNLIKSL